MNIYDITIIEICIYFIIIFFSRNSEKKLDIGLLTVIFMLVMILTLNLFFFIKKDDFMYNINNKLEKIGDICLNNEKGFLYTDICYDKKECADLGNIIAYRYIPSLNQIQAVYFNPYQYQNECNKDDSKAIINMLNDMKKDFTILIN